MFWYLGLSLVTFNNQLHTWKLPELLLTWMGSGLLGSILVSVLSLKRPLENAMGCRTEQFCSLYSPFCLFTTSCFGQHQSRKRSRKGNCGITTGQSPCHPALAKNRPSGWFAQSTSHSNATNHTIVMIRSHALQQ